MERFEFRGSVGRGAFSVTLRCLDRERDEEVLLKLMHLADVDAWKHVELFQREAATQKTLQHPGIPTFYDAFELADEAGGQSFCIVQQLVPGRTLAELIAEGPRLDAAGVEGLARELLDILGYLHSRVPPVLHRDIKPSNVIVGEDGRTWLVDFGAVRARLGHPEDAGSTVVGTHGYMPPEQYLGHATAATDLYALGATLLHVATATPPSSHSFEDGRLRIPERTGLPEGLVRLTNALLEPVAKDRPQSASAATELLEAPPPTPAVPALAAPTVGSGLELTVLPDTPRPLNGRVAAPARVGLIASAAGTLGAGVAASFAGYLYSMQAMLSSDISGIIALAGGVAAALAGYAGFCWWRWRRLRRVLREGTLVVGRVSRLVASGQANYSFVAFDGKPREGSFIADGRLALGDPIQVVHAPDNPDLHVAVP